MSLQGYCLSFNSYYHALVHVRSHVKIIPKVFAKNSTTNHVVIQINFHYLFFIAERKGDGGHLLKSTLKITNCTTPFYNLAFFRNLHVRFIFNFRSKSEVGLFFQFLQKTNYYSANQNFTRSTYNDFKNTILFSIFTSILP